MELQLFANHIRHLSAADVTLDMKPCIDNDPRTVAPEGDAMFYLGRSCVSLGPLTWRSYSWGVS